MIIDPDKRITIEELKSKVQSYYPDADVTLLQKAFTLAQKWHEGQKRHSGEDYIHHPLAVAGILADMRMDLTTIVTGILHDTVEDTATSLSVIEQEFGVEVKELVDGVTKLSQISFRSSHEKQAENFRKMLLAMAKDLRVILVKLADRTHNMLTLEHCKPSTQQKIAQETLEIYAPLANRLGISWMKTELEDLCLRYLHPEVYKRLSQLVAKKRSERENYIDTVVKILQEKLSEFGLQVEVTGRAKHFYSIYKKMELRNVPFEEIHDLIAFRIITKSVAECYEALGIVHSFFKPVPGRFKDYIAMPKNNMYQSLHTTVVGPFGERVEIQIRTEEMHKVAELGIAAHWKYKDGRLSKKDYERFHWLRNLLEDQDTIDNPVEFIESVKLDLFEGDIYVFTPKGELLEFPHGSTPLDFAYAIHTDVGNHCVGAKVNGRIVSLKYKLRSGDAVEILTSPNQKPSKDWLKLVKTGRAKSKIRQYIKLEERNRAKLFGSELLDREFRRFGMSFAKFEKAKDTNEKIQGISFANMEDLLVATGYGKVDAKKVVQKLYPDLKPVSDETTEKKSASSGVFKSIIEGANKKFASSSAKNAVRISGMDNILIHFCRSCHPIPGDDVVGYITRGRGVTVHKVGCPRSLDHDPNRAVDVSWSDAAEKLLRDVRIRVTCLDEPGLLNRMSKVISDQGVNIKSLAIRVNSEKKATGTFDLQVTHRNELGACIRALEGVPGVISVERMSGN